MNRSIEILVIHREFIVPDSGGGVGYFVAHEPDTIVAVIRFDLSYHRASPGSNGRLLPMGGAYRSKAERLVDSGYAVAAVRSVVIHVALVGMTLAPGAFVRNDVIRFGKIRRARV